MEEVNYRMNQKKTIIYIGGFELPDKNAAAQRVLANSKIFRDLGFDVVLIGIDKMLQSNNNIENTQKVVEGFEFFSIPYPKDKKSWFKHIVSAKYLNHFLSKKDNIYAVICYNYPALAMYNINIMCKRKNIICLADATEWYENSGGGLLFNTIKWLDTYMRMHYVHCKIDGVITVSKFLTDFYKQRSCHTVQLPTLYDVAQFEYTEKKETKTMQFMYAGSAFNLNRVTKDRDNIKDRLDIIIETFSKVYKVNTNFILNIYGLTKENYLSVFSEHKNILIELSKHIIFHGRCPHQHIIGSIQQSDFTIFIRKLDRVIEAGFPSKFSESISYGIPVISNLISNIEPYIAEGKNSFIVSLDNEETRIKKILYILDMDRHHILKMKKHCKNHKIFDYRNYLCTVDDFFKKIGESK